MHCFQYTLSQTDQYIKMSKVIKACFYIGYQNICIVLHHCDNTKNIQHFFYTQKCDLTDVSKTFDNNTKVIFLIESEDIKIESKVFVNSIFGNSSIERLIYKVLYKHDYSATVKQSVSKLGYVNYDIVAIKNDVIISCLKFLSLNKINQIYKQYFYYENTKRVVEEHFPKHQYNILSFVLTISVTSGVSIHVFDGQSIVTQKHTNTKSHYSYEYIFGILKTNLLNVYNYFYTKISNKQINFKILIILSRKYAKIMNKNIDSFQHISSNIKIIYTQTVENNSKNKTNICSNKSLDYSVEQYMLYPLMRGSFKLPKIQCKFLDKIYTTKILWQAVYCIFSFTIIFIIFYFFIWISYLIEKHHKHKNIDSKLTRINKKYNSIFSNDQNASLKPQILHKLINIYNVNETITHKPVFFSDIMNALKNFNITIKQVYAEYTCVNCQINDTYIIKFRASGFMKYKHFVHLGGYRKQFEIYIPEIHKFLQVKTHSSIYSSIPYFDDDIMTITIGI